MPVILIYAILGLAGVAIGYVAPKILASTKKQKNQKDANLILENAKKEKEKILSEARNEALKIKDDARTREEEKNKYFQETESSLRTKENYLQQKEQDLKEKVDAEEKIKKELEEIKNQTQKLREEEETRLQEVAGLKKDKAKEMLFRAVEKDYGDDLLKMIREKEEEAREDGDKIAQKILASTLSRLAQDFTAGHTVSAVAIPNDEMKGRIIGREGRNIQTFERLAGVDLIIDDTPEVVTVSSFDPVRREIARMALEQLIKDGRIHPARIEALLKKAEEDVAKQVKEAGEHALYDLGISGVNSDLVKLLGRLKFRTSFGQNVLQHSIEVARIASMLAEELKANVLVAKMAGIFHDIGKAVDHEVPGSHAAIGKDILKKYGISDDVIAAVVAHHEEVEPKTAEDWIIITSDMVSGARPGARREATEEFIKRVKELENIAVSFPGVEKAYAIQAGREVRVFVQPEEISDYEAKKLAKNIAQKIEHDLKYPGEIKVVAIRETRTQEIAH
ncbi:MAG: ribonuclease Y [Patescibacteria group bacterium]|nr:ribonuclease Y [Patescibacteria group bacterium]